MTKQDLVDIIFQIGFTTRSHPEIFGPMSQEEYAEWIRKQLKSCGLETEPCGLLWGIIIDPEER